LHARQYAWQSEAWPAATAPDATVVVPSYNRSELLARLFRALEAQTDAPSFELIVVDDASSDATWDRLDELCTETPLPVMAVRLPENSGPAAARNAGWRRSRGPVVLFTDDDCVPTPGWVRSMVGSLVEADYVQGATHPDPEQAHLDGPFSYTVEVSAPSTEFQTCNMGYRRALLERLDGFDERFRTCEDTDLAIRARKAGAVFGFSPQASVVHDVRRSAVLNHLRGNLRWSAMVLLVKLHPELRRNMYRRIFWRRAHPLAALAVVGVAAAATPMLPTIGRIASVAGLAPYIRLRTSLLPLRGTHGAVDRAATVPIALLSDVIQIATMTVASIRYRTLLL
jgi:glycosyltransferase involved in cell wall biosynthesis